MLEVILMTSRRLWCSQQPWADQVHIDPTKTKATVRDSRAVAFLFLKLSQFNADFTAAAIAEPSADAPTRSFTALMTPPIAFGPV